MDAPEIKNENINTTAAASEIPSGTKTATSGDIFDLNTWKSFYQLTGGSLLYCLSAVFVAYGIVKVMGPILSEGKTFQDALLCIITLHIYEIALLGVLILIVSRKIVDDAVSLVILAALFLIGTSMALGSVSDRNITASFLMGIAGVAIAYGKIYAMRRFVKIPLGLLSISGLVLLMAINYFGPAFIARSISAHPSSAPTHRELWMLNWVTMLVAGGIVFIESMRKKYERAEQKEFVFLQSTAMVYIFALILLIASGVHQYSMSYMFSLERRMGDYIPLVTLAVLFVLEIVRVLGKRLDYIDILISCIPCGAMLWSIYEKTVIASGQLGFGIICYPPVFFALSGLAIAAVAFYHKWYRLMISVFFYGLGVILTIGFSPQQPYDLNIYSCVFTLVASFIAYGIIKRNQMLYITGIAVLSIGLMKLDSFPVITQKLNLTEGASAAGVFGIGCMVFYLIFGKKLHKVFQIFGAICLSCLIYDSLPPVIHWSYLITLLTAGCLMCLIWFIRKNIPVIVILLAPFLINLYIIAKYLSYWRHVILGFLLLAAGALASLFKCLKTATKIQENERQT